MDKISLSSVLPNVFAEIKDLESDVWRKEVHFEKGNTYLIEAASGKGKSSFCSFVYGYRKDFTGGIYFNRTNLNDIKPATWDMIRVQNLSLLFQDLSLFPELTALENVLLKNNLTNYQSLSRIRQMFGMLGIEDKLNQKIEKMSWGQQQRVAIIRCLCQPMDFLILDEPISHLDDKNASVVAQLVDEEISMQGAGVIATSIGKHLPLAYTKQLAL